MSTHTDLTPTATADARTGWPGVAPWAEIARWAAVAALVAAILLGSVAVIAGHVAGNAWTGAESGLLYRHHDLGDVLSVLRRNLLVLGIHLCACWIGAIIGRPHRPAPSSWGRIGALHRPVPDWMRRAALFYALAVTMLSVAVQAIGLGRQLADVAAATQLSSGRLLILVLPHAVPELLAVFLPLGLFLLEARRGRLDRLGAWSLQAAAIAIPVLVGAALIETYVTPGRVIAAVHAAAVLASLSH
jgi:hypothetical protein